MMRIQNIKLNRNKKFILTEECTEMGCLLLWEIFWFSGGSWSLKIVIRNVIYRYVICFAIFWEDLVFSRILNRTCNILKINFSFCKLHYANYIHFIWIRKSTNGVSSKLIWTIKINGEHKCPFSYDNTPSQRIMSTYNSKCLFKNTITMSMEWT